MTPADTGYHLTLQIVEGDIYTIFTYSVDEIPKDIQRSITDRLAAEEFR